MISKFIKWGLIFTAAHFVITWLFVFVGLLWWGHGGSGAPNAFVEKLYMGALQVWTLGDLPYFLSSPIFGFILGLGFVMLRKKPGVVKSV